MLNVLGLSWDYCVRNLDKNTSGDFMVKQQEYAKLLNSLVRIIYSPRQLKLRSEDAVNGNLRIIYSNSVNKLFFFMDVIRIVKDINKNTAINVISAEDPVFTGLIGVMLKRIFLIPLNVQIHYDAIDNRFRLSERKINYLYNFIAKWVVRRADSIRVPSEDLKNKLIGLGINENRIYVIPVRVSVSNFEGVDGSRVRSGLLRNNFKDIILYVGRLSPEKDIPTLLRAFKKVVTIYPKTLLVLAGEGRERGALLGMANDLSIRENTDFVGSIEYHKLPEYYAACDIFVLPSLREGRASVLVEAMLARKPIITTKVSGAGDCVVDGKTGYIIGLQNYEILSEKILILLNNPDVAKKFGEEGYLHFNEKLKYSNSIEALIRCWEETVLKSRERILT